MTRLLAISFAIIAAPAFAASGPFFSLRNTDFVVTVAFIVFVGVLLYFKVPAKVAGLLDARAAQIKSDLDEARALREEAKSLLASYERRQMEVKGQADQIISAAKAEAEAAAAQAKEDLKVSIARRLAAAEDQIKAAETSAIREVRERAVSVAIAAAGEILSKQMTAETTAASVDAAIAEVGAKLH